MSRCGGHVGIEHDCGPLEPRRDLREHTLSWYSNGWRGPVAASKLLPARQSDRNPIERLWGLMHRNITHNKCYATCSQFADATLGFLREQVPRNWAHFCDSLTDNFRVISPKNFRVMT